LIHPVQQKISDTMLRCASNEFTAPRLFGRQMLPAPTWAIAIDEIPCLSVCLSLRVSWKAYQQNDKQACLKPYMTPWLKHFLFYGGGNRALLQPDMMSVGSNRVFLKVWAGRCVIIACDSLS